VVLINARGFTFRNFTPTTKAGKSWDSVTCVQPRDAAEVWEGEGEAVRVVVVEAVVVPVAVAEEEEVEEEVRVRVEVVE
jgi:hypothetical protein